MTDERLSTAIIGEPGATLIDRREAANPVLFVQKLCDRIIEREHQAVKRLREEIAAPLPGKWQPTVRLWNKDPKSGWHWQCSNESCGSAVGWDWGPEWRVCGRCVEPIDTRLRLKVCQAVAAEAAGETAESRIAKLRAAS